MRVVPKPWGHEIIWAHTDRYVGKVLHIRAGEALSLQYHEKKDDRWRALVQRHLDQLWSTWSYSPEARCHLWEIHPPFGTATTHLGGCHGLAGNVMALMQVIDLVPLADRLELYRRCAEAEGARSCSISRTPLSPIM